MSIKNNTTSLQDLLDKVNALPEAENLDTEISTQSTLLSEQDAKIAELAQVLAGKAGGGSGGTPIETCTVTVNMVSLPARQYLATIFTEENGISSKTNEMTGLNNPTIVENVVCGSSFYLLTLQPILAGYSVSGGASLIKRNTNNWFFSIPQKPTGEVVITVREDD